MIIYCKICNRECGSITSLAAHLRMSHPNYSSQSYYDEFLSNNLSICTCGKELKFVSLSKGFQKFCSYKCHFEDFIFRIIFFNTYLVNLF
jgi:hypothetical protein